MIGSRFDSPSTLLSLRRLLSKTRRVAWIACALALGVHLTLSQFRSLRPAQRMPKPLTTKFVKRQPRLTKPLEMKKLPRPKRRPLERTMVAVRARATAREASTGVRPADVVARLSRPRAVISRITRLEGAAFEPREVAQYIQGARQPRQTISMSLDLVDLKALDTGQYQAMVIQDPTDKRNIKGFFHMARLRSRTLDFVATSESLVWTEHIKTNSMLRVAEAVNRYTGIVADYRNTFTPDDRKLLRVPLVFLMPTSKFQLTENEGRNLGVYLTSGGLLFGDWGYPSSIESIRVAVEQALASQGISERESSPERLPNDHPLFQCFFEFDGPPAAGREHFNTEGGLWHGLFDAKVEGVTRHGLLVAIISEKWYTMSWGAFGIKPSSNWTVRAFGQLDPTRALQFGVNIVVFALTQEGSITRRLMESVK